MVLVDIETNARQLRGKIEVGDLVKHVEPPTRLEDGLWAPLSRIYIEGPKPVTRGGEWEPIKISSKFESSAYVPKSPKPSSVLTKV
jgi:hypothetical protein